MKKLISILIASLMAIGLCACGGGNQCEHQASEDSLTYGYYERTTATCSQGGIEYHSCTKCGASGVVEVPVEAYGHRYELGTDGQDNFKCLWCDETQITLNALDLPKEVVTNYSHGNIPLASKMNIKNVELAVNVWDFDFTQSSVTLKFDVEATQITTETAVYKYLICFVVKDQDGNVVWEGQAKAQNHEYGERDLRVGDTFTALSTCATKYLNGFEYNKDYTWTVELVNSVIIEYSSGNKI